ncbi:HipA domain-containing protein [Phaeovulum sp.]|uniref:HipA domain-containing protein n=1 Tax=Phaeovulum sp. TaxID=2934796 RepID=UPI0027303CCA|nr:HipA domain-containing protein [Phaeovulum sp.]MDP1669646.1 HipA domain-containing protein [Phaeovulum sp.]MDZ4117838.1 HipA domain-containing protein [Phaeovulum sp.]
MARVELDIHLEGRLGPVGRLEGLDDGTLMFRYLTDDLPFPISMSLPLREEPYRDAASRAFFSNLLFENAQREQVMERHSLDFNDVAGLLYHLGRDCPGAISCVPKGEGPAKQPGNLTQDYDPLGPDDLAEIMCSLRDFRRLPDKTRDPSPLAGVQGKVALARLADGRFGFPKTDRNVPTTHILKVPRTADMRSVDQEHILMGLMAEAQRHPVAATEILGEGDLQGLLITRFDRRLDGTSVSRVHQEDFCQALGLGPHLKYQRNGTRERSFSARSIGELLSKTANPGQARQAFLEVSLVNLLLGNADNHAKNHALLYQTPRPVFAPVYDVVSTIIDAQVLHQLSFDVGRANMTDKISTADIEALVMDLGFPRMTPALRRRLVSIIGFVAGQIGEMAGPARKRLGDAIAEQARPIAAALGLKIDIPERDAIYLNRPD